MAAIVIPYHPREVQKQIHEAIDRHRFSVIVAHRRMGKTVAIINHLIKSAVESTRQRPRYGYIAPLFSQAKSVAWDYLKHFTAVIPNTKRNESELWIELVNGARIRLFGADNPDSLRGLYFDGVCLDEVAQMRPEVWGEVIRPALTDRQGYSIFIGTPKGINLFYDLFQLALRDDKWFAGVYPVTDTDVLSADEIAEAKASMSEAQYRQEFLCDFTASSEDIFIPLDLISESKNRTPEFKEYSYQPVVMGVDVARFGDDMSVVYLRQGVLSHKIYRWHGLDLMSLADSVASIISTSKPKTTFVDGVGVGAGVVDRLRQLGYDVVDVNAGGSAQGPYVNKRAEMWGRMRDWMKTGGQILDDNQLITDLSGVRYSYDVHDRLQLEKKVDMKKRGLSSPDAADALALTFAMPTAAMMDYYDLYNDRYNNSSQDDIDDDTGY
jgi:hypothetical protein